MPIACIVEDSRMSVRWERGGSCRWVGLQSNRGSDGKIQIMCTEEDSRCANVANWRDRGCVRG
eukprot:scaffold238929_cov16-Tisochrysis_lutea.AAC.2